MRIRLPAASPEDWKRFLADPDKQWREGYSAYELAHRWHKNEAKGFPREIRDLFKTAPCKALHDAQPLLILPEHKVSLPRSGHGSQNDIFVLAKAGDGELVSMTVEGKVHEPFDERVGKWKASRKGYTTNKQKRFLDICDRIGLPNVPDTIYYQLLHRTASAVIEAETYNAAYAVMIVHSFSAVDKHWEAFDAFVRLYGKTPRIGQLIELATIGNVRLFAGWARGHERYLKM